jgi:folate-binding protein YgfZ
LDRAATSTSRDISSVPGLEAEYRALRLGAGIRLCAERVVIRMSGDDRATFLHGMCSNDINGLEPGGLVPVLFLTERAHIIGDASVWSTADALLLEMDRALWPAVRAHLERFLVADDVELEASDEAAGFGSTIQIDGPQAAAVLAPAFAELTSLPAAWRFAPAAGGVLVAQVTRWGAPAFTILAPRASGPEIVARLTAAADGREIREVGIDAVEVARVESGTARVGLDTNDKTIALEARMEPAISFNKGCYIGQETVERATARGALKRRLMGLRIEGPRIPAAGARVTFAGKEVGHLSSPVRSPRRGVLALAILHHSAWTPGSALSIEDPDGQLVATVSELPFADD